MRCGYHAHDARVVGGRKQRVGRGVAALAAVVLVVATGGVAAAEPGTAAGSQDEHAVVEQLEALGGSTGSGSTAVTPVTAGGDLLRALDAPLTPSELTTVADGIGDAEWARGDILAAGVGLSRDSVFVAVSTVLFSTPGTTPWTTGTTGALWNLDVNGDHVADFHVTYVAVPTPVLTVTRESDDAQVCSGVALYDSSISTYYGGFDPSCIGDPSSVDWNAFMAFEDVGIQSADIVPDNGWAGPTKQDTALPLPGGPPIGSLDVVAAGPASVTASGWALDPETTAAIDVHVYVDGRATVAAANRVRTDVAGVHPAYGAAHGFQVAVEVPGGAHEVCAYGINEGAGANALLGCAVVTVPSGPPFGSVDAVTSGMDGVRVAGWVIDPDTAASVDVHVYVDGVAVAAATADGERADVANAFGGYGAAHGYDVGIGALEGAHEVCVYGINAGAGDNALLGCRQVLLPSRSPFGSLDLVERTTSGVRVAGWVVDPDDTASLTVHVYVDGVFAGDAVSDHGRDDLLSAVPGYGAEHGFDAVVPAAAGERDVCVYGINVDQGSNALIGCRRVSA
jgi:hypothetical protein